jgi:integrase
VLRLWQRYSPIPCKIPKREVASRDKGYVDLSNGPFYRQPSGSKATRKRAPTIPLPSRLIAHIKRWEAKEISRNFVVEWNGKPVKRIKKSFNTARIIAGLDDNVTPHVLRHTAATWLMQNGVDLWEAAGYLGMSVETLERTYGHHHPHYLANARDAIARQNTDSYLRTEDERSFSGVMKKDKFSRKVG